MFNRFNTNRCKTQAKLCIGRVRLMRNKRENAMKQMRREVAELLRANKQENARIRVEAVIREQNMLQAYEVLEVFLELLSVRLQLIENAKDIPNDMFECLASLVYSAARIQDFPELTSIRAMLGSKFGKEFIETSSSDNSCKQYLVNDNLIRCLAISAPDPEVKLALLSDIAQEHGVEWDSHRAHQEMVTGSVNRGYGSGGFGGGGQGPPSNFGGPSGSRGGGGYSEGAAPIYVPPPDPISPPPNSAPSPQSKLKNILKKVPTIGRSSPSSENLAGPGSEEWRDAHSAASAAREYSQKAQHAADAAQRYVSSNASSGDLGPPEQRPAVAPAGGPPLVAKAPPPRDLDYPDISVDSPSHMDTNFGAMGNNHLPGSGTAKDSSAPGGYRQRSDEEIQRAYDAAPGPPAKTVGPPSAPPAPKGQNASPPTRDPSLGLPTPPVEPGKVEGDSKDGPIDEDLAARFEALKRG